MKSTVMLTREEALAARRWFVIDAQARVLGRVASEAAKLLRGKGKPNFTPHVDCGDFVVVVNAEHVRLTGTQGIWQAVFPSQRVSRRNSLQDGGAGTGLPT